MTGEDETAGAAAADQEWVRRELASAPEPGPMPEDVAARLDDVLAGLVADRADTGPGAGSPHRDRSSGPRRWPSLLAAAAVVALLALGVGSLVTAGGGGQGGAQSEAGRAAATAEVRGHAQRQEQPLSGLRAPAATLPHLRSATLARDVRRLLRTRPVAGWTAGTLDQRDAAKAQAARPVRCLRPPRPAGGSVRAVVLDGRAATLVVGPARRAGRTVEVYACRDVGTPLATVAVPRG